MNGSSDTIATENEVQELLEPLIQSWRGIAAVTAATGVLAFSLTFAIPPTFTAKASFLPPQQQNSASAAVASLGALASLAGGSGSIKSPVDQFISLMTSATVSDRIIADFQLRKIYDVKLGSIARKRLNEKVRITAGKKDGIIYIEVDDHDAKRAADIANRYIEELRRITSGLALSEAAQRRVFFESQLKQSRERLALAQQNLQNSGFSAADLKSEPRAAAEAYGRLKAEQTSLEVRLRTLRTTLADSSQEIQAVRAALGAIGKQITKLEDVDLPNPKVNNGYVTSYREYKYEEALFDIYARQFEMAKSDESREGALIQIIDSASVPDRKSKPSRAIIALGGAIFGLLASMALVVARSRRKQSPAMI